MKGRGMRRKDREVDTMEGIEEILGRCRTCHVAMLDGGAPYVVPLSFGYKLMDGGVLELYFHSAPAGKKIDLLKRGGKACFEMSDEGETIRAESPCEWGYKYSSVIGYGATEFIYDPAGKREALSVLFRHQTGLDVAFNEEQAAGVCVFKIVSTEYTGKHRTGDVPSVLKGKG